MPAVLRFTGRLAVNLLKLVALLLALVIMAIVVLGAITTQRGWPQVTGTIAVEGLHHPVTVARDRYGIIQITAEDPHDLFLAQGYVHAQERMWQMEVSRRIGAGRLSELFGRSQVDTDRFIRTLGWRQAAQRDLDSMSPTSRSILQFYADGVNAWIAEHDGRLSTPFVVAGALSGTWDLGGYDLEPWTPLDTATWQKVQAWSLGGNVDSEIFRYLADARLGDPAKTDELFPAYEADAPVVSPSDRLPGELVLPGETGASKPPPAVLAATPATGLTDDHAAALADLAGRVSAVSAMAGLDRGGGMLGSHGVGSNNWVVSGSLTSSGKPILANDPHLGFGMPSVWIMNGLHCLNPSEACPWDVIGVSFPGAPAVVLGHNARIAWGATNVNPDTQDLYVETLDPADPARYRYKGSSVAFQVRHETIKVAGGSTVEFDVRSTVHGPVLSDVDRRLKDGPVLALRWTTTSEVDLALESFFKVNLATDFDEFRAAFDGYGSPSQNFIYADVDGHIGYVLPGRIPIRDVPDIACPAGCPRPWTGERVHDGESGIGEWDGYVPQSQLPWQLDPEAGWIVSANNAPVDDAYRHWLGNEYDPGYRAARIIERLAALPGKATLEDMRAIQLDVRLGRADRIVPLLFGVGAQPSTPDGRTLWSTLAQWDMECTVESAGCAAYVTIELAVLRAIFDDELGPLAGEYVGSVMSWQALIRVLGDPTSSWWAQTGTGASATTPAAVVAAAVDAAASQLRQAYGDPGNWTWGRLHQVEFRESTLGTSGIPPLEWYFNSAPRPVPGADGAVNNTYYRVQRAYADPYDPSDVPTGVDRLFWVTNGPSYRLTVDMNDLDGARIVITTGQSGNAFDQHYGDLIPLWAEGQTLPLPFSPGNVQASAAQTLTLTPP